MKYKGVDMQIKPAVLVKQHFKIIFRFPEFFNCLVVSRLNHAFHNIDPPAKKEQATKSKASSMASKLHKMFDAVEEMGAWTEVAGVTAALLPEDFH
jgi:hypothetical protein